MNDRRPTSELPTGDRTPPAERLRPLLGAIADAAPQAIVDRAPSRALMEKIAQLGLLQILPPISYGGEEATALEFFELVETAATIDGSTAWAIMTLNEEMEIAAAYQPPETMTAVCTSDPKVIIAGSGITAGRSTPTSGGWRVSGRWSYVTGGPVADHLILGTLVEGDAPRSLCYVLVPATDATILDTWDTFGMRGTGSNDVVLDDVFVPHERAGIAPGRDGTVPDTTLFRLPSSLRFPFPKVGIASGIARAAIDAMVELASVKAGRVTKALLRDQPDVQIAIAEAEADWAAGRAFAIEMLSQVWDLAEQGSPIPPKVHARTRLACSHSVAASVRATERVAALAGTTANNVDGPFARRLADVRAVPQHFMVGGYHRVEAGRVLLGLTPDDPMF